MIREPPFRMWDAMQVLVLGASAPVRRPAQRQRSQQPGARHRAFYDHYADGAGFVVRLKFLCSVTTLGFSGLCNAADAPLSAALPSSQRLPLHVLTPGGPAQCCGVATLEPLRRHTAEEPQHRGPSQCRDALLLCI